MVNSSIAKKDVKDVVQLARLVELLLNVLLVLKLDTLPLHKEPAHLSAEMELLLLDRAVIPEVSHQLAVLDV